MDIGAVLYSYRRMEREREDRQKKIVKNIKRKNDDNM